MNYAFFLEVSFELIGAEFTAAISDDIDDIFVMKIQDFIDITFKFLKSL